LNSLILHCRFSQELLRRREEGQNLLHATVNWGEKTVRNTRSDGRDAINSALKELQNDWDRLVRKISTTKVQLETSLLQWADYSSSYSQLQQWISDRENKLQQVCEQKVRIILLTRRVLQLSAPNFLEIFRTVRWTGWADTNVPLLLSKLILT